MNFPQVFDTWDSGSHGLVASLSGSLVLGSSSPRIGLLVAFWATFQARALRRNWARACFVVRCLASESESIEIWSARAIGFNRAISSSLLWFLSAHTSSLGCGPFGRGGP